MEIGNPFAIDNSWIVSNISLNTHGSGSDKQKVTVRLFSPGSKSVIRQQMTQEEYDTHFRDTWRLGRRINMFMTWQDENPPMTVPPVGAQQQQQQPQQVDMQQLLQQMGPNPQQNLGRANPTQQQ